ncbi:Pectinesterase 3 [Stylosanthes scabra]|uniref:Pectinesterase n=1 Tax=Stylosanthes scabra TaxID=79078 RepID=A0ABU6US26_9FABA|nr:Pectinesterase 3 [Stylosanthes scabra]
MDSINSFKGYGKVDEAEQQAFQKKTRKRLIILIVSSIVLITLIIAAVLGTVLHNRRSSSSSSSPSSSPASSLKAVCEVTQYPNSCMSSISSLPDYSNTTDPHVLFSLSLRVAINELSKLSHYPSKLRSSIKEPRLQKAIDVCSSVLADAIANFNDSISSLDAAGKLPSATKISDIRTWVSAAITNQDTCLDALQEVNSTAAKAALENMQTAMKNSTEFSSNSLAIVTKILGVLSRFNSPVNGRRLMGFPEWVGVAERRLLLDDGNTTTGTTPDAVVAADGSAQYKTIKEAVVAVKKKSVKRFVIYVKAGTYVENIDLDKDTWNVMIYGDGMDKTIISGSRNFIDGTPTFETATFAAKGKGFIAKDIGFKNTAGADKHQAVALRSGSDQSVFYRCSFDGFQDTLYAHSNRQFYRDCDISGTIDFIFGNAAVVFQNCKIMPRQPLPNQFNTITAQGKKDPNQDTGIVIQKCSFVAFASNLQAPTYLGRPWKDFSTTVIMQSNIGPFLNPVGWISWVANVDPPKTIFYGEYLNTGPRSDVSKRVTWAGYNPSLTQTDAAKFTVQSFIQGPEWLPNSAVTFDSAL